MVKSMARGHSLCLMVKKCHENGKKTKNGISQNLTQMKKLLQSILMERSLLILKKKGFYFIVQNLEEQDGLTQVIRLMVTNMWVKLKMSIQTAGVN